MRVEAWAIGVLLFVLLVVLLAHSGVNVGAAIAQSLHGIERALGQPL
jgi:hypothetical protein